MIFIVGIIKIKMTWMMKTLYQKEEDKATIKDNLK